jgi:peptidase M23-like protein
LIWKGLVCALLATQLAHAASTASAWPPQLEMQVPFEPTAFLSGTKTYLTYELYLTNFAPNPVTLCRIEVLDADESDAPPIATIEAEQLDALLQSIGNQKSADGNSARQLVAGGSVVVFLWIVLDKGTHIPNKLTHRVIAVDFSAEGTVIGTHHTELKVLGSPVQGANWTASDGPSNGEDNHHRRGVLVFKGRAQISRRYAIDWQQIEDGRTFSGDASDLRSYHAYGKPVLAVADSTVVIARDGLPDNAPGHNEGLSPAVPITPDTVAGNTIVLDLGGQQFVHYLHLQTGSLRVKAGDHVRRGQVMAQIGDSGDAREPHLHFQVSTSSNFLAGEGVPYLIDQYSVRSKNDTWELRTRQLPLGGMLIDFGQVQLHSPGK